MQPFLVLVYSDPNAPQNPSNAALEADMQRWNAWHERLLATGRYIAGDGLTPDAITLQGQGSSGIAKTDGPFAEANEVVGGYYLVLGNTLDDVAELMKGVPFLQETGRIEIRAFAGFMPENAAALQHVSATHS